MGRVTQRKQIDSWLSDMDGVLVHEGQPVPGADSSSSGSASPASDSGC